MKELNHLLAGIGHNQPPDDPATALRAISWARVKAARKKPSVAVIRLHMARAGDLGLSYADFAAIHAHAGRAPEALIFTPASLGLVLGRRLALPVHIAARLARVRGARLFCLCPPEEEPEAFRAELSEVAGARFAGCARLPDSDGPWSAARGAAQALLLPLGITGSAALMIGDGPVERMVCAAGRLADCLPADRYFR